MSGVAHGTEIIYHNYLFSFTSQPQYLTICQHGIMSLSSTCTFWPLGGQMVTLKQRLVLN